MFTDIIPVTLSLYLVPTLCKQCKTFVISPSHSLSSLSPSLPPFLSVCLPAEWLCKLDALVMLADRQVEDRREELLGRAGAGPHVQADIQRQLHLWTLRQQLYCRMRESFHHTGQRLGVRGDEGPV